MRRNTSQTLSGCAERFGLVALLCLGVGSLLSAPAHAAFPGANGKIAFATNRDGNDEIYTMNADGTNQTRLTNNAAEDDTPVWSADGSKVAFRSFRDGNAEIYTMNADGTGQTNRSNNSAADHDPAWSPDGTQIAFRSDRDGNSEIYTMNGDGTGQSNRSNNAAFDSFPAWSPDGTKIAFITNRDGNAEIYTMNADGTNQTRLTNNAAGDDRARWSPDGAAIVFETDRDGNFEIYTMNADGTGQTNLTTAASADQQPAWSPDGTKIAFSSLRDGNAEIYTMNANGTGQTNRSSNSASDQDPDWQPLPVVPYPTPTYPAPKSASPMQLSLLPVFKQCGTGGNPANTTHGPPLSAPSCNPPKPTSTVAAVGNQAVASAAITAIPGNPFTPANEADDSFVVNATDIRAGSRTGPDYNPNPSGPDLTLLIKIRITDLLNGGSQSDPGTATEMDFAVPVDCAGTVDTTIGSTCTANTTANAVMANAVKEGKSQVLNIFRVRVNDSGANGIRADGDDKLFLMQGIFNR